jgi:hypothetical protein
VLRDHGSYWSNPDGFVLPLLRVLMDFAESPGLAEAAALEREPVGTAARRRAWRVGWLPILRTSIAAAAVYAGVRLWHDLERAGRSIAAHAPEWIRSVVSTLFKPFEGLLDALGLGAEQLLAAALIVAAAGVLFAPVRLVWSGWNRREVTQIFRREPVGLGGALAIAAFVIATWGCIVLIQAGAAGSWDAYVRWLDARDQFYYTWTLTFGFFVAAVVMCREMVVVSFGYIPWLFGRLRGSREPALPFTSRVDRAWPGASVGWIAVTTALLLFPRVFGNPNSSVWPVFAVAIGWAATQPLVFRVTANKRAEIREMIIARTIAEPTQPAAAAMVPRETQRA